MRFSICIPNFNYAHYLSITFGSINSQQYRDFEVVVSDNASTDGSLDLIRRQVQNFENFAFQVNPVNVGFAGNLDKVAGLASGDYLIMLSSDDLMTSEALAVYSDICKKNPTAILSSSWDIIDKDGVKIGYAGPAKALWNETEKDELLSAQYKCPVYRVSSPILLQRCLKTLATPFNFCTVSYKREWYLQVGGYGGGRLINPDKWFHWKLLTVAKEAIFIDRPLFQYRWHNQNQSAQQRSSGYLKYMVDEYRNVIEMSEAMLSYANVSRDQFESFFIERDIYKHGMGEFLKGRWLKSMRIFFFGLATFPGVMITRKYFVLYSMLLLTTPLGSLISVRLINLFTPRK